MYYNKPMTRKTDISSDLDINKNNTNSTMLTGCFFDNNNPDAKRKFVFDLAKEEAAEMINRATSHGKTWESSD